MTHFPKISPFKLLQPYDKGDVAMYFGRENETRQLAEVLMRSKFLLIYGGSGTGKTSLIQCGLQGMFSPRDWLPIFVRKNNNFLQSLKESILEEYQVRYQLRYPNQPVKLPKDSSLRETIKALFNITYVPIYLILDQFEEIFTLGTEAEQQEFFKALEDLQLFDEDIFCKLLIISREEYIAHFYQYEKALPFLFEYRFRVEKMRSEQLLQVIDGTLNYPYDNYPPFQLEHGTVNQILHNLTNNRGEIDLTDLQVYLDRLYREDLERKSTERNYVLFDKALVGEHKLDNVIADFLDQQITLVSQRITPSPAWGDKMEESILQILFKLVTEQGTKQNRSVLEIHEDLKFGKLAINQEQLEACLQLLAAPDIRILNLLRFTNIQEERFEIWHDRLAAQLFKKFNVNEIQLREARVTLQNKKKRYEQTGEKGEFLSTGEITLINQAVNIQQLQPEEQQFLIASRQYRTKQKRLKQLSILLISLLGIAALWFGVDAWQKARISATVAQARLKALENPTEAKQILADASFISQTDPSLLEAKNSIYSTNPFYLQSFLHAEAVKGVAMAPDSNGTIYSWTEKVIYKWNRNGELQDSFALTSLSSAALSPNGQWLIAGTWDGALILLEAKELKQKQKVNFPKGKKIEHLLFLANSETILLCNQKSILKLNVNKLDSSEVIQHVTDEVPTSLAFHHNNRYLGYANGNISVVSPDTSLKKNWNRHQDQVLAIAPSPDGKTIASTGRDALINLWNPQGGLNLTLKGHDRRIDALAWTKNGQQLLSAGTDYKVKLWSPEGDLITTYKGHNKAVKAISLAADGKYFVSAGEDKVVRLWKIDAKVSQKIGPHDDGVSGVTISKDGTIIGTASDAGRTTANETFNDQDFDFNNFLTQFHKPPARNAYLWNRATGEKIVALKGHQGGINGLAKSRDDALWATASDDGSAIIWNKQGEKIATLEKGHQDKVLAVEFSNDGQYLVTAGSDSTAILWTKEGKLIHLLPHPAIVSTVAFSTKENTFVTGCYDGITRLYDFNGQLIQSIQQADSKQIEALTFSPNGQYLLVGEMDNISRLYSLAGKQIFKVSLLSENKTGAAAVRAVAFSPDGKYFCLGTEGGLSQIYLIHNQQPFLVQSFQPYPARPVLSVTFSSDAKYLLTGTNDGWARLWKIDY